MQYMPGKIVANAAIRCWIRRMTTVLACLVIPCLLALAGNELRQTSEMPVQTIDAARQVIFIAQPEGAVRVLYLRNSIGELGMLRAPQRREVRDLALDASGHWLWVLGDDAAYRYDAYSLHQVARVDVAAAAGSRFVQVDAAGFSLSPVLLGARSEKGKIE